MKKKNSKKNHSLIDAIRNDPRVKEAKARTLDAMANHAKTEALIAEDVSAGLLRWAEGAWKCFEKRRKEARDLRSA